MTNFHPILDHRSGNRVRAALSGLFFLLLCSLPARAGAAGGNSGSGTSGGLTVATAPGDDVTSLPVTVDTAGITLVSPSFADLRNLALTVRGQGRIDVLVLPRGGVAVTFAGSYLIEVDRDALALGRVGVLFRSGERFTDGRTRLELGGSSSVFLTPHRLVLPLARLAQSAAVQGEFLSLGFFGPGGDRAHVATYFGTDRVTLFQRLP